MSEIGKGVEVHEMQPPAIVQALRELEQRHAARAGRVTPSPAGPTP
jgi:hypothetical protein